MSCGALFTRPFSLIYLYKCLLYLYNTYFPQNQQKSTKLDVKSQGTTHTHTHTHSIYIHTLYLSIHTHTHIYIYRPYLASTIPLCICVLLLSGNRRVYLDLTLQCSFLNYASRLITINSPNCAYYEYKKSKYTGCTKF